MCWRRNHAAADHPDPYAAPAPAPGDPRALAGAACRSRRPRTATGDAVAQCLPRLPRRPGRLDAGPGAAARGAAHRARAVVRLAWGDAGADTPAAAESVPECRAAHPGRPDAGLAAAPGGARIAL